VKPATAASSKAGSGGRARQRGISLLVVMVVVLLSSLLALWAFRTSLVNETIVGNDADYQRAFEAAQAMIQDAELDIQGARADGTACVASATDVKVCRMGDTAAYPLEIADFQRMVTNLRSADAAVPACRNGICLMRAGAQDFWTTQALIQPWLVDNVGARYGEYTGALPATVGNPLLSERRAMAGDERGAWYWVEVMQYTESQSSVITNADQILALNLDPRVVYRITAVARGLKPRTQVVLQSTFVRQKLRN
jgi:type IV pilus assembly protein PilX